MIYWKRYERDPAHDKKKKVGVSYFSFQQQENVELLDLEYVKLNVSKLLEMLNKTFVFRQK